MSENLYVTKTFLPPLEEYVESLREIWESGLVTNDGVFYRRFEDELREFTGVEHLACVGNGTIAIQLAIRALDLSGEVITTPFTHVASSGSLYWENCEPVYCDIDPDTWNINPAGIEEKVTARTTGILGVHVYSNPCAVGEIEEIANQHDLKVIYDGAHAFGATLDGKAVLSYGDLSTASFNATKAFHTMEGGAVFGKNSEVIASIRRLAYFGMDPSKKIKQCFGTNAKLMEVCAALGSINLRYFPAAISRKKNLYEQYRTELGRSGDLAFQKIAGEINYSYMPVAAATEALKKKILEATSEEGIFPREYFDTNLETVFSEERNCPVADDLSKRILCLPMSDYLSADDVKAVCSAVLKAC